MVTASQVVRNRLPPERTAELSLLSRLAAAADRALVVISELEVEAARLHTDREQASGVRAVR